MSSSVLIGMCATFIVIAILMVFDFFGGEINTSGYVENNIEYADNYISVVNKNITKNLTGYVSLSRIVPFYLENDKLTFDEIYTNNLDLENKQVLNLSDVCDKYYKNYSYCTSNDLEIENTYKPFNAPIDFSKTTITSFFGQERIVFGNYDVHYAWDLASPAQTPVYSVGDGIVTKVRFNQKTNVTNESNGGGNYIIIKYDIDDKEIYVTYAHLYPDSNKVKEGDLVSHNQLIGTVGTTGYSTGNHLHYEVKINGNQVDGMDLINLNYESQ